MGFMDLHMSHERALQLFASVDPDGSGSLDLTEFTNAFDKLEEGLGRDALRHIGITPRRLITSFILSVVVLLLLFLFILLGISGLTTGSEFGAVINSLLPCAAGTATAVANKKDAAYVVGCIAQHKYPTILRSLYTLIP